MTTPSKLIEVEDQYYILATSAFADDRTRILKDGETFAVFDLYGDFRHVTGKQGLYHEGTRFLSRRVLLLGRHRPFLLGSAVKRDNALLSVHLTNPDLFSGGHLRLARGTVHILRTTVVCQGSCSEHLRFRNYGPDAVSMPIHVEIDADFADLFEVRGMHRRERGSLEAHVDSRGVHYVYAGLDGVERRTHVTSEPAPTSATPTELRYEVRVPPGSEVTLALSVTCEIGGRRGRPVAFEESLGDVSRSREAAHERFCRVRTSNAQLNDWVRTSVADLCMMETATHSGPYPYAGVPWYDAPFGRDGIVTALECLEVNPDLARGVLRFLAATQAHDLSAERDAEPGKIVHELRLGEMAALGEHPFGRYYGSVDATPLFVVLAGAYLQRTGDLDLLHALWPSIELALAWIDVHGDADGDGFVEYQRRTPHGLTNQGWKDSSDAVFHADGTLAEGAIALCEVQGYVYAARRAAAAIALALGHPQRADALEREALALRARFEAAFWQEDLSTYAIALDGHKRPCRVRTSNAGHCLWSGIASPEHAARVAETLLDPTSFSGWGLRTVAASEARYNPMSYHNGSVWPHDSAVVAAGFARYGFKQAALRVAVGLFEASQVADLHRLPELFCGFARRPGEGPTLYPVACSPQAWASAAVFQVLTACLGLTVDAPSRQVRLVRPVLPDAVDRLVLEGLPVAGDEVDLVFERHGEDVGMHVPRRTGPVEVVTVR